MAHVIKNRPHEWPNPGEVGGIFGVIGAILQRPGQFFEEIRDGIGLQEKVQATLLTSLIFLALYGAVLGSGHPLQALSSALKLPLVFLASLIACAPTLYIFDQLLGSKRSLGQTVAILLTSLAATSVLLFSFIPVTVALRLMVDGYQFFKLLNVAFVVIAMAVGIFYLVTGLTTSTGPNKGMLNNLLYICWILLFLFMVSQVAWSLRPFFHYPGSSFLLWAGSGNLFTGIGHALGEFLGFSTTR